MSSVASKIIAWILRSFRFNRILGNMIEQQSYAHPISPPPRFLTKKYETEEIQTGASTLYLIKQKESKSTKWIYYLHGGAFVQGIQTIHWQFVKRLLESVDYHIAVLDYPLLPHTNWKSLIEEGKEALQLLQSREDCTQLAWMGDSAGAGLVLALAQDEAHKMDHPMILISPWLDFSVSHPTQKEIETRDAILTIDSLRQLGQMLDYPQNEPHQGFGPLYGDSSKLSSLHVFTSSYDLLTTDAIQLKERYPHVELYHYEKMLHDWILFGIPESKQAIKQIQTILEGSL